MNDEKDVLLRYLQSARAALLWKLDGLSEYDVRRPMTPTGTNLLGLVKHVATVEWGYLSQVFDRPFPGDWPWDPEAFTDNDDMFATADESRELVIGFYQQLATHSDQNIVELSLDAVGRVPWWPPEVNEVTLQRILVHVIAETNRHGGHADILREQIDGQVGLRPDGSNLPELDDAGWKAHVDRVEAEAARAVRSAQADQPAKKPQPPL